MISAVMPPRRFFADSVFAVILRDRNGVIFGKEYYQKILYLAAIFNSFTFDYMIRFQVNTVLNQTTIKNTAIPTNTKSSIANKIIALAADLSMSDPEFAHIAQFTPHHSVKDINKRAMLVAKLDALVAHNYGLTRPKYEHILSTFSFKSAPLNCSPDATWDNTQLHAFHNAVKAYTLKYYDSEECAC